MHADALALLVSDVLGLAPFDHDADDVAVGVGDADAPVLHELEAVPEGTLMRMSEKGRWLVRMGQLRYAPEKSDFAMSSDVETLLRDCTE